MQARREPEQRQIDVLRETAQSVAASFGLELYDIVCRASGPRGKIQVFLSRPEGSVTLDDCERVSRQLSRELDVLDPIGGGYDLEVSSPGLERLLREAWHWRRSVGESVALRWRDADGRVRNAVAVLEQASEELLRLRAAHGEAFELPISAVLSAHIHVDW